MSRKLIVCCDGTANEFGTVNTNVVRVVQSLRRNDPEQLVYYDPGVGTLPDPSLITRLGQKVSTGLDLAFATSLNRQVSEACVWLMNNWRQDDRIYIFGFSRGAYTARVVAALLHHIGLLPPGGDNLIPYAIRLLHAAGKKDFGSIGDEFRATFSRDAGTPDRRLPIRFLGVWDTVSSVGWVWDPVKFRFTARNPSVQTIRHAIALDERRAFYRQNRMVPDPPTQDLQQLWFAGVHSDIGGGYNDSALWHCSFDWMLSEAGKAGLSVDLEPAGGKPWLEPAHDELARNKAWWLCEFFPKRHFDNTTRKESYRMNRARPRELHDGELLHPSLIARIREDATYRPPNLSREFIARVLDLPDVPREPMAYASGSPPPTAPAAAVAGSSPPPGR